MLSACQKPRPAFHLAQSHQPVSVSLGQAGAVTSLGGSFGGTLGSFAPIGLEAIKSVSLANRLDTKFVFGIAVLPELLERIRWGYLVLTVDGVRAQRYETLYFDTPKLDLYLRHHNGVYPRHKIRCRRYVNSGLSFLEVKTKRNTGRTIKQRIPSPWVAAQAIEQGQTFLQHAVSNLPTMVSPVLHVDFTRLTLVNVEATERVTIDLELSYRIGDRVRTFPRLVIAEIKRDRAMTPSGFVRHLRELRLREGSVSKYCLGIMSLYPTAKRNRFKERLNELVKLAA